MCEGGGGVCALGSEGGGGNLQLSECVYWGVRGGGALETCISMGSNENIPWLL